MSSAPTTERLFSLSCFEGLKIFRTYRDSFPDLDSVALLETIAHVEADAASLDLEAAAYLDATVESHCPLEGEPFYQGCIKAVVISHQPIWAKSMRQGRARFIDSLSTDDRDVFAAAGLLGNPPSMGVVQWWDDVVGHARLAIDIEKMAQARKAEALTIQAERERLLGLGIAKEPEWTGLDDNFAGYDVLSYDLDGEYQVNKMIEVKSTVASPLRFYLSRNEWNTAEQSGSAYWFHVWNLAVDPPALYERTVEDIRPHIPTDNEKGKWSNAEIPISN